MNVDSKVNGKTNDYNEDIESNYLIYNLSPRFKNKYQIIYFDHLIGSTYCLSAKFSVVDDENGKIKRMKASFRSETIGGLLHLSLADVANTIEHQPGHGRYNLEITLKLTQEGDPQEKEVFLDFGEEAFDINEHYMRIDVPVKEDKIIGIKPGMLIECEKKADNERSCIVKFGGG